MVIEYSIALVILIVLSAFFSGTEIAMFSLSEIKVRKLVRRRKRGAKTLAKLKEDPHRLLTTILIGNNLINILAASIATVLFTDLFGSSGVGIATGVMTFLVLVFGEITPKTYFYQNAERMARLVAKPIWILSKVLYPVIVFVEGISSGILRLMGKRRKKESISQEEIREALSLGAKEGVIQRDEEEMIHNIFEFGSTQVRDVMTPKKKMFALSCRMQLGRAMGRILEKKYSRIPLYKGSRKNIVGMLNVRDMLKYIRKQRFETRLEQIMGPAMYVKEDQKIDLLMDDFRESGMHMAVVVNKKNEVKGLVTLEDILEEIVGEIYDEPDIGREQIRFIDRKTAMVNGDMLVKHLQQEIGIPLRSDKATISELVSARFDGRPKKGKKIKLKNFIIRVSKVNKYDPSKVTRIKITKRRGKIRK